MPYWRLCCEKRIEIRIDKKQQINAQNERFFLKTIPFDNIVGSPTGKTIVFNSDSTIFYEVPRYFEIDANLKEIYLSNDGRTIVYVIDRASVWKSNSVEIFKNGISVKQYQLTDLINCNFENKEYYYHLFYKEAIDKITREEEDNGEEVTFKITYKENVTDFEKKLIEKATFLNNDTLYIFANTGKLIEIDLNTSNLNILTIANVNEEWFRQIKPFNIKSKEFHVPHSIPNLSNGKFLEYELAKYLDMEITPKFGKNYNKYKYIVNIDLFVDTNGDAFINEIHCSNGIPEDKIKAFIESQKFNTDLIPIPNEIEMWRFNESFGFMNKNEEKTEEEGSR